MSSSAAAAGATVDLAAAGWAALLRSSEGFSVEEAKKVAILLVAEPDKVKRTNQCTLAAAAVSVNRSAFLAALALFPESPFKVAVVDAVSKAAGGRELNYSAMNAVGWLVFSSGVPLRQGFREVIQRRAGATSWAEANFAGFSQTAKDATKPSGAKVASDRRSAFGVDAIRKATLEVQAAILP